MTTQALRNAMTSILDNSYEIFRDVIYNDPEDYDFDQDALEEGMLTIIHSLREATGIDLSEIRENVVRERAAEGRAPHVPPSTWTNVGGSTHGVPPVEEGDYLVKKGLDGSTDESIYEVCRWQDQKWYYWSISGEEGWLEWWDACDVQINYWRTLPQ